MFDLGLTNPYMTYMTLVLLKALKWVYLLSAHFSHSSTLKARRNVSLWGVCDTISTCLAMVVTSISMLMDITTTTITIIIIMVIITITIEVIVLVITHFFGAIRRSTPSDHVVSRCRVGGN